MSYYIKQIKKNDCGYTSIKMYLASLSKNKDFLFMQDSKIEKIEKHLQKHDDMLYFLNQKVQRG